VLRVSGPSATVRREDAVVEARVAPRLRGGPPVAGDLVELREADPPLISAIAPRRTVLERWSPADRRARPVVANADLLVVVGAAVDPPLRPRFMDRYLVAAWAGGLDAALVVTKLDLATDRAEADRAIAVYREAGYPVLAGSAKDPGLVRAVRDLIGPRAAALVGHSGVGKSTLTRGLTGVERATGAVSAATGRGRHTTTDPRLIPIPGGGSVIDTAGVRTFHIPRLDPGEIPAAFPEIAAAASGCRFRGCRHAGDAGCAVPGRVAPERLESYRRLIDGSAWPGA
jgi:ribosome biogenesis GTPase